MRTPRECYSRRPIVYTFELDTCLECGGRRRRSSADERHFVGPAGGSDPSRLVERECYCAANQRNGRAVCQVCRRQYSHGRPSDVACGVPGVTATITLPS